MMPTRKPHGHVEKAALSLVLGWSINLRIANLKVVFQMLGLKGVTVGEGVDDLDFCAFRVPTPSNWFSHTRW